MATFDEIVTLARQLAGTSGMTDAEFDYLLATNTKVGASAISGAAYELANARLPVVGIHTTAEDLRRREANARALVDTIRPELDAMITAAKLKKYTGWSVHSTGPIQYA